ncbi:MAG: T9SS type A sorting domain-containing protein [Bacteroidota bacterium]
MVILINFPLRVVNSFFKLNWCFGITNRENRMKRAQLFRKVFIVFCLVLFGLKVVVAQENSEASGGIGYGAGGSVSYSIGQIDYEKATGPGGDLTEGLQQPYEIMVVSGIEDQDINLTFSIFPNPTSDFVVLTVHSANTQNMAYTIFNIEGKLIEKQEVDSSQTTIAMKDLANGIYFIKVLRENTEVKIFKVIKNI